MERSNLIETTRETATRYLRPVLGLVRDVTELRDADRREQVEKAFEAYVLDPNVRNEYAGNPEYYNKVYNYILLDLIEHNTSGISVFDMALETINENAHLVNPNRYLAFENTSYPALFVAKFTEKVHESPYDTYAKLRPQTILEVFGIAWHFIEEVQQIENQKKGESRK